MNGEAYSGDTETLTEDYVESAEFDLDDDDAVAEFDLDDDDSAEFDIDDDSAEFDIDDDESAEFDDDDDDSAEFLPGLGLAAPFIAKGIGGAISGVNRILSRRRSRRGKSVRPFVPRPSVPNTAISGISQLFGQLRTSSGRRIPFRLPKSIATKKDIATLRKAIRTNTRNSLKNSKGVKRNISGIVQATRRIRSVDRKHTAASKTQNRVMGALNRRVRRLKKDLDETKQQAQMQMMISLLMQPELSSITVEPDSESATPFNPATGAGSLSVSESDSGDDNLALILALSGGFGGSGNMGGMNPMMLLLLADAI